MPPLPHHTASPPALFPTYLIPSLPFRRRKSSTDSTSTTTSTASSSASADSSPPAPSYLAGHTSHLRCARCASDLALSSQIISKGFTGRHGRAYLVGPSARPTTPTSSSTRARTRLPDLPNTYTHRAVPRQLVTGAHTVGDISCAICGSVLGWKYISAEEEGQKYKVGKFILETRRVVRSAVWEGEVGVSCDGPRSSAYDHLPDEMPQVREEDEVEFDSQDEDECEDLFMGVWTPELAMQRRRAREFGRDE